MGVNQVYYRPIYRLLLNFGLMKSTCMLLFILKINENFNNINLNIWSLLSSIRKTILLIINNEEFKRFLSSKMSFGKVYQNILNKNQKYKNFI